MDIQLTSPFSDALAPTSFAILLLQETITDKQRDKVPKLPVYGFAAVWPNIDVCFKTLILS